MPFPIILKHYLWLLCIISIIKYLQGLVGLSKDSVVNYLSSKTRNITRCVELVRKCHNDG